MELDKKTNLITTNSKMIPEKSQAGKPILVELVTAKKKPKIL